MKIGRGAALTACLVVGALMTMTPAMAQQRTMIAGEVRDAQTGVPLDGAQVRVVGSTERVVTDAQGRFRISVQVQPGVELEADRVGYLPQRLGANVAAAADGVVFSLTPAPIQVPEVAVIGRIQSELVRIAGSASIVTRDELTARLPLSGNEALRRVAGVHIQEEEGAGLRANIGIRGLNPDRSRTVLILEDGVPVALNPYGEPEMYYTPPVDRMERLEVVKGSGSILFGPQTIGGVINYVTPAPAASPGGSLLVQGGNGGFIRTVADYGGTWGNVGAHVTGLRRQANDLNGLWFNITDVTGKVAFDTGPGSRVGVKLSVYDEESNSTYVGLTQAMYDADHTVHPAPDDRLYVRRYAVAVTHDWTLPRGALLRTTAYGYTTTRNWRRQDFTYTPDGTGIVFASTSGHRNRSFEVLGVEPRLQLTHEIGGVFSEFDAGLRVHYETAEDAYIIGETGTASTGNVRDYELRYGRAVSVYAQNRFHLSESVRLTPGFRLEYFDYDRNILRTRVRRVNPETNQTTRLPEDVDIRSGDSMVEVIPGIGVTWLPDARFTVFAGAHRGFSPPRVKDALVYPDETVPVGQAPADIVSLELDAERSWNFELGTRAAPWPGVVFEATGFLLDFSNQIVPPSLSAGSAAQAALANQGRTRHTGVESAVEVDIGELLRRPFTLQVHAQHTYVRSRQTADRFLVDPAGDTVNVRGYRLPYAPEHMLAFGVKFDDPRGFGLQFDGTHVASQYADLFETEEASADGTNGLIPAYTVFDAGASLRVPGTALEVVATVKNVFDRKYIASRRPQGIKPGLPRLLQVGLRLER